MTHPLKELFDKAVEASLECIRKQSVADTAYKVYRTTLAPEDYRAWKIENRQADDADRAITEVANLLSDLAYHIAQDRFDNERPRRRVEAPTEPGVYWIWCALASDSQATGWRILDVAETEEGLAFRPQGVAPYYCWGHLRTVFGVTHIRKAETPLTPTGV